jgi:hypothetical protein
MQPSERISREEVQGLPHGARVVFAARCARRVLPLLIQNWPDAPEEELERALALVEQSARQARVDPHLAEVSAAVNSLVERSAQSSNQSESASFIRGRAARAVAAAALCACTPPEQSGPQAFAAYDYAKAAAGCAYMVLFDPGIRRDLDCLRDAALREHWTDDSAVPAGVLP